MATWVRSGTGSLPSTVDANLTGTVELDNGTAPGDFDPDGVNSVRIQMTVAITAGSYAGSESSTVHHEALLTLNAVGSTLASTNGADGTLNSGTTSTSMDVTDSTIPTGFTAAQWEGAELNPGNIAGWTTYNQDMGKDGVTVAVSSATVTIDYNPATAPPQNLGGSLYSNAPSFFTGTAAPGAVDLTGALFSNAATFNAGAVAATYDLAGSLFQSAPTFFTGAAAPGAVDLTGNLFQNTPSFNAGAVGQAGGTQNLGGALFQSAPSFNAGAAAATYDLAGAASTAATGLTEKANSAQVTLQGDAQLLPLMFQPAPTFFTGAVTATADIAGNLFQNAPTFPQGAVGQAGSSQNLAGSLFQSTPTFPQGAAAATYDVAGALYQNAPSFPQGAVSATADIAGTLFTKAPTFPQGEVAQPGGAQNLTGSLYQNAPSFPQGAVTRTSNRRWTEAHPMRRGVGLEARKKRKQGLEGSRTVNVAR